jgi:hypothetical protein
MFEIDSSVWCSNVFFFQKFNEIDIYEVTT